MNLTLALGFMKKVLPEITNPDGNWVLCSRKKTIGADSSFEQTAVRNLQDAEQYFKKKQQTSPHPEVYLSLAELRYNIKPYGRAERKATQCYNYRCLAMDIDCGPDKPYKDYIEGNEALQQAMDKLGITDYLAIMSGSGIHCYILLNEIINKKTWIEMSTTLSRKLNTLGLKYDKSKIKEPAMLLRVAGTYNLKKAEPVEVVVIKDTNVRWEPYQLDEIFDHIEDTADPVINHQFIDVDKKGTWDGGAADYKLIESNCAQIKSLSENANVAETIWYAGIGIAAACANPIEAAKAVSINYDNYSEVEVVKKLHQYRKATTGPTTCARFLEINEGGCSGCPHRGTITTPVQLGKPGRSNNPFTDFDSALGTAVEPKTELAEAKVVNVAPTLDKETMFIPSPYFLSTDKSICREVEGDAQVISQHPLYVSQIATLDSNRSPLSILTLRFKVPHKPWQELEFEVALLTSASLKGESLGAKLMNAGFYLEQKDLKKIQSYIIHSLNARQMLEAPEKVVGQYGWTKEGTFILGNVEYGETVSTIGVAKNDTVEELNTQYAIVGLLEQWKLLSNVFLFPDTEIHAFTLFLGFGAPLMSMSNIGGCIVNLQSEDTGIGKSTMGYWAQSIYGHPIDTSCVADDTSVSLFIRLGILNNVPLHIDDISPWEGDRVSEFIYAASTGQEKARGTRDAELRDRNQWNTLVITSSNPSLIDLLDQHTTIAQGQKARLLEIPFPRNEQFIDIAQSIILGLTQNHGVAGAVYLQDLVRRQANGALAKDVQTVRQQYEAQFNFHFMNEERFIFTAIGTAWLGAKIAQEIGLINDQIDLMKVFRKINQLVLDKRRVSLQNKESAIEAVSQFIIQNHKNFVKVRRYGMGHKESDGSCPNESLFGRIELLYANTASNQAERGYISVSMEEFKKFCKNSKRAYIRLETELGTMPTYKRHAINLASGISKTLNNSDSPQLQIWCLSFELPSDLLEQYTLTDKVDNVFNNIEVPF